MIISLSAFIFDHNRERTMSRRPFHSLAEAQAWAAERVGPTPELGTNGRPRRDVRPGRWRCRRGQASPLRLAAGRVRPRLV